MKDLFTTIKQKSKLFFFSVALILIPSLTSALTVNISGSTMTLPDSTTVHISGSVGVYTEDNDGNTELKIIDGLGNTTFLIEENPNISQIYVSPSGFLYILFSSAQLFNDGKSYILGKLDQSNGTITGVDSSLTSLPWSSEGVAPNLQFDSSENIYYLNASSGDTILRKYTDENNISDLTGTGITMGQWLVLSDGTVVLSGTTNSTSAKWVRKLTSGGSLSSIVAGVNSLSFILEFPDSRVYAGLWNPNYMGVYRLSSDLAPLKDYLSPYIGVSGLNGINYTPENESSSFNGGSGFGGANINSYYQTSDNKIFVLANNGSTVFLVQYYDTVQKINLALIDTPSILKGKQDQLFIAGTKSGTNKLIQYSTADGEEKDLLSEDIEVYKLDFQGDSKLFFEGLRFSDNRYIIGTIPINISGSGSDLAPYASSDYSELAQTSSKLNDFYTMDVIANIPTLDWAGLLLFIILLCAGGIILTIRNEKIRGQRIL